MTDQLDDRKQQFQAEGRKAATRVRDLASLYRACFDSDAGKKVLEDLHRCYGGSTAGHKGLKSIGERFDTNDYPRLRIGIRPANQRSDLVDYVLATFHGEARDLADPMTALAADTVEAAIDEGIDAAMSRFNGVNLADDNDEA